MHRVRYMRAIHSFLGVSTLGCLGIASCGDDDVGSLAQTPSSDLHAVDVYAVPLQVPDGMDATGRAPSKLLTIHGDSGAVWIQVYPASAKVRLLDAESLLFGGREVDMTGSFEPSADGVILYAEAEVLVQLSFTGVSRADMESIVSGLHLGTEQQYEDAIRER
jgi:hypothetical protein